AEANRLIAEPLEVTRGEQRWTVGRAELAGWLVLPTGPTGPGEDGAGSGVGVNEERIRATLQAMAAESDRPAQNARLEVQVGEVTIVPGEPGEMMDVPATAAAVQAALGVTDSTRTTDSTSGANGASNGNVGRTVAAVLQAAPPELTKAKLEPARAQAARIIGGPLTVRFGDRAWTLPRDEVVDMLLFGEAPGSVTPYLSRSKLLERLQPVADEFDPVLEKEYAASLKAWETRRQVQAEGPSPVTSQPAPALGETGTTAPGDGERPEVSPGAGAAPVPAAEARPVSKPADDPKPTRRWVDVPATAAAVWAAATTDARVADVRLTTDDPATTPALVQPAAQAAGRGKWVDVDVTTQSLVAYEGDWPVFRALVSTGLPRTPTPVGTYRVFTKLVADDMRGGSVATGDYYFLPKVPYVMYFLEGGYALHGTYWHSNFGHPMSHGCVNLTPEHAKWLFDWAPLGTTVVVHQ
ncbi:MAG: L,D-transpeptidase family protein, partial [Chloroflexota bacterium]